MGLSLCWLVLLSGFSAQFTCQFYLPNHLSAYCMHVWKERAVNSYTNSIAAFVSGLLQKAVFVLKRLKCQMRRGRCFSHFYTVCFHHTNVIVHTSPKSLKPCLALPFCPRLWQAEDPEGGAVFVCVHYQCNPSPLCAECSSKVYSTASQDRQRKEPFLLPLLTHGKSAALPQALVSVALLSCAIDLGHKMGLERTQHHAFMFLIGPVKITWTDVKQVVHKKITEIFFHHLFLITKL